MQVYKVVMRHSILAQLVERLKARHDVEFPLGTRSMEGISIHEIDALLYLRRDPEIDALRGALTRLDNGTYGKCIGCRSRIEWSLLLRDPVKRVCPVCDNEPRGATPDLAVSAYPGRVNAAGADC